MATDVATTGTDRLQVMMEEFKALRGEILQTLTLRIQIISFGLATIGVLLAGAINAIALASQPRQWLVDRVAGLIMVLVVPFLCLVVEHVWLSEVKRGRRASWYLMVFEKEINRLLPGPGLSWEGSLRGQCPQMKLFKTHYQYVLGLFSLTALASLCFGWYSLSPSALWKTALSLWTAIVLWESLRLYVKTKQLAIFDQEYKNPNPWPPLT
jgi:hypothetical protein